MKKEVVKKSEIEIRGVLGAATPYRQGGSLRIILPKQVAKYYLLNKDEQDDSVTFVFLDTNHGVLMKNAESLHKESSQ